MGIVELEQGTKEWHEWRASGIGGSDIATVLGKNPYKTPYKLYCERTGRIQPDKPSAAMLEGIRQEPFARALFEQKHGMKVKPVCYEHDEYPWVHASLDGLSWDGKTNVQIKVRQPHNFRAMVEIGDAPEYMFLQTQWEMLASGAERSVLFVVNAATGDTWERCYDSDPELQAQMRLGAAVFWECLQEEIAPSLCDEDLEFKRFDDEESYAIIKERIATLQKEEKRLKERILLQAGSQSCRGERITVKHSDRETVDWKAFATALDPSLNDIDKYTKTSTITTIRLLKV